MLNQSNKRNGRIISIFGLGFVTLVALACGGLTKMPEMTETHPSGETQQETKPVESSPSPDQKIGKVMTAAKDGMVLVSVAEGDFEMGSNNEGEKPVHTIWLDAFWIDQTEVTNAMYTSCVGAGSCKDMALFPEKSSHPVVGVDWSNAEAYCTWAGRRLPTEAEWEKAARGTDGRKYPWGNDEPSCNLLNYDPSNGCVGDTREVGIYPNGASPNGVLDMAGNVGEWTADWYDVNYYNSSPDRNPVGPDLGEYRVLRGGSWINDAYSVRASSRSGGAPILGSNSIGFRCATSSAEDASP